jgi:hypothetical protein
VKTFLVVVAIKVLVWNTSERMEVGKTGSRERGRQETGNWKGLCVVRVVLDLGWDGAGQKPTI